MCTEKGIRYNMLEPQMKQKLNHYTPPVMADEFVLPVQVKLGQKQPSIVEGVLTIIT